MDRSDLENFLKRSARFASRDELWGRIHTIDHYLDQDTVTHRDRMWANYHRRRAVERINGQDIRFMVAGNVRGKLDKDARSRVKSIQRLRKGEIDGVIW